MFLCGFSSICLLTLKTITRVYLFVDFSGWNLDNSQGSTMGV